VPTETASPYHLAAGEGEKMSWFTAAFHLKASDQQLAAMELEASPGDEPPMHVHRAEDEWYYLLDGEVSFHAGQDTFRGAPGSFVFLPRSVPHTFTIETPTARMLLFNAPGGFERMFERAPSTPEEAVTALASYGVEVVGPHPRALAEPVTEGSR
jgi:quercetin dioxygenase-like cupin family protein